MSIIDIYSKRIKQKIGDDIFVYDILPKEFRVQIILILDDALGNEYQYKDSYLSVKKSYSTITNILSREYGVFNLVDNSQRHNSQRNHYDDLREFILNEKNTDKVLDAVELSFRILNHHTRNFEYLSNSHYDKRVDDAIEELNKRFLEHGIGYQFEDKLIIRIDSKVTHAEITKPTLSLLSEKIFQGAQEEFINAYDHFRHSRNKEAINECLKSFESVLKIICQENSWEFSKSDGISNLLKICFENELIPSYLESKFNGLRAILESGSPTVRNNISAHGQGNNLIEVPPFIASYVLNITASSILFLIEANRNKK